MKLAFSQSSLSHIKSDLLVLFVSSDKTLFDAQKKLVTKEFPAAAPALDSGDFIGKKESNVMIYTSEKAASPRLLLVGFGETTALTLETLRRCAAQVAKVATGKKLCSVAVALPAKAMMAGLSHASIGEALTEGIMLAAYKFDKYFSDSDAKKNNTIQTLTFCTDDKKYLNEAKSGAEYAQTVGDGVLLARALANAPNSEIYPETLAKAAQKAAKDAGFTITVLDKKKIAALRMNGLLAVNQGSVRPPVFLVMEYNGGGKKDKPIVLVGKGVTFDTGGISIKPAAGMGEMRMDMHGSASVIGAMYAAAKLGIKQNIVGLVPATENMPSGSALVPGDVITYSNGVSVEVDNTDAEGRLILADALIYAQRYKPQAIIDLATLTGACVVALGFVTSGLFGTDEALKTRIKSSADYTNEYVCELPLYSEYEELIKSDIADIKNAGGRWAGAITAALFLKRFIKTESGEMPWVHLDIAGPAILPSDTAYMPKNGSGVCVRLLCDMLRNWK